MLLSTVDRYASALGWELEWTLTERRAAAPSGGDQEETP